MQPGRPMVQNFPSASGPNPSIEPTTAASPHAFAEACANGSIDTVPSHPRDGRRSLSQHPGLPHPRPPRLNHPQAAANRPLPALPRRNHHPIDCHGDRQLIVRACFRVAGRAWSTVC